MYWANFSIFSMSANVSFSKLLILFRIILQDPNKKTLSWKASWNFSLRKWIHFGSTILLSERTARPPLHQCWPSGKRQSNKLRLTKWIPFLLRIERTGKPREQIFVNVTLLLPFKQARPHLFIEFSIKFFTISSFCPPENVYIKCLMWSSASPNWISPFKRHGWSHWIGMDPA